MKKTLLAISLIAMLGLTSCGINPNAGSESESSVSTTEKTTEATEETTEEESEDTTKRSRKDRDKEDTTEETTEDTTEETTEKTTAASSTKDSSETTTKSASTEVKPVEGLGDKFVDFDNRAFAYDGKVYKVGETTLQELIDGGVPIKEKDLKNKDNNVNKNRGTSTYNVDITDFTHIQLQFLNLTEDSISEKDCILSDVRWYSIYVPKPSYDDERNDDINDDIAESQTHVSFAFPLALTKDELLANSPDTTKEDDYNNVEYKIDSTQYYGSSGYHFQFDTDSNQLKDVTISWLP